MERPLPAAREVLTIKMNQRLRGYAIVLQDKQLLAKLSNGNVIAKCNIQQRETMDLIEEAKRCRKHFYSEEI